MPSFKCLVRGENFPGAVVDKTYLVGFYTTRFVEAIDTDSAEDAALSMLRRDSRLKPPSGLDMDPKPKLFFESVTPVAVSDVPSEQPGIAWFPMDDGDADFHGTAIA